MENSHTNPPTTSETPVPVPIELESLSNTSNDHAIPPNVSRQSEEDPLSIQTPERAMTAPPPYTPDYTPAYTPTRASNNAVPAARVPKPVVTTPLNQLQDFPAHINCPLCHQLAKTSVRAVKPGASGSSGICTIIFCFIVPFLMCIPTEVEMYTNFDHYCDKCGSQVAHKPHGRSAQPFVPAAQEGPAVVTPSIHPPPQYESQVSTS